MFRDAQAVRLSQPAACDEDATDAAGEFLRRDGRGGEMGAAADADRATLPEDGAEKWPTAIPPVTMLRIYFLQNWYVLSDPMAEEMHSDSDAMRRFVGIEPGDDRIPAKTTILNFRHLLEKHRLTERLFGKFNRHLADRGARARWWTRRTSMRRPRPRTRRGRANPGGRQQRMTTTGISA